MLNNQQSTETSSQDAGSYTDRPNGVSSESVNNDQNEVPRENYEVVFFARYNHNPRPSSDEIIKIFSNYGIVDHVNCPEEKNYAFVFMKSLSTDAEYRRTRSTITQIIRDMTPETKFHITVANSYKGSSPFRGNNNYSQGPYFNPSMTPYPPFMRNRYYQSGHQDHTMYDGGERSWSNRRAPHGIDRKSDTGRPIDGFDQISDSPRKSNSGRSYNRGQYQQDNQGQYQPDNQGQSQPDSQSQFQPDSQTQYQSDSQTQYQPRNRGKYQSSNQGQYQPRKYQPNSGNTGYRSSRYKNQDQRSDSGSMGNKNMHGRYKIYQTGNTSPQPKDKYFPRTHHNSTADQSGSKSPSASTWEK